MPQYLVIAHDYTDTDALQRRMNARPRHLARMKDEKTAGRFVFGGATLSNNNTMNGSMLVIETADEQAANNWVAADPYVLEKVWNTITIVPFRTAVV